MNLNHIIPGTSGASRARTWQQLTRRMNLKKNQPQHITDITCSHLTTINPGWTWTTSARHITDITWSHRTTINPGWKKDTVIQDRLEIEIIQNTICCQIFIWCVSDIYLMCVRYLSDVCQIFIWCVQERVSVIISSNNKVMILLVIIKWWYY